MADCFSGHHPLAYYGSLCILQRAPEEIFFFILGMPAAIAWPFDTNENLYPAQMLNRIDN
jgi:hypothetical protein